MIKPCYRNYKPKIDSLFIGFRREANATPEENAFWAKKFPNIGVGETVAFAIQNFHTDARVSKLRAEFPLFDFDYPLEVF